MRSIMQPFRIHSLAVSMLGAAWMLCGTANGADKEAAVWQAAASGDAVALRQWLTQDGTLATLADGHGRQLLHVALHATPPQFARAAVQTLLDGQADVNARDSEGRTPLYVAALASSPTIVRQLLEHGADPTLAAQDGQTPLHAAILAGRLGVVDVLAQHGVGLTLANADGLAPLALAESLNHIPMSAILRAALGLPPPGEHDGLALQLLHVDTRTRSRVMDRLVELGSPAVPSVQAVFSNADYPTAARIAALRVLTEVRCPEAVTALGAEAVSPTSRLRIHAVRALGEIGHTNAVPDLILALDGDDMPVSLRMAVCDALGKIGDPRCVDRLVRLYYADRYPDVRRSAAYAIDKIADVAFGDNMPARLQWIRKNNPAWLDEASYTTGPAQWVGRLRMLSLILMVGLALIAWRKRS